MPTMRPHPVRPSGFATSEYGDGRLIGEWLGGDDRITADVSGGAPPGRPRNDGGSISRPSAANDDGRPPDDRDEREPPGSLAHSLETASGEQIDTNFGKQRDVGTADAPETDRSDVADDLLSLPPA